MTASRPAGIDQHPMPAGRFFSSKRTPKLKSRRSSTPRHRGALAPLHQPRGQALILIVFAIVALVAITGLAVDGGNSYADRRRAQNAADSAALAGALGRLNNEAWLDTIHKIATTNGYNNDGKNNSVEVYSPPISGAYEG